MSYDVFISYSSSDKLVADAICARLEEKGVRCWIAPRDIRPGKVWAGAIAEAISECRIALLILSGNSNSSNQVAREIDLAAKNVLTIVPFRIDDTQLSKSLEYYLNNIHWLDALTEPREKEIEGLCGYLQGILANEKRYVEGRTVTEITNHQGEVDTVSAQISLCSTDNPTNSDRANGSNDFRKQLPKLALALGIILFVFALGIIYAVNVSMSASANNKEIPSVLSTNNESSGNKTSSDFKTLAFDNGKDEHDKLSSKIHITYGGSVRDDIIVSHIPEAAIVILLDRPDSQQRDPKVEQLFSGMFTNDVNYLNVKNKDGKVLAIIHGDSKEKLMALLDKIQASDLNGEKYVKY